MAHVTNLHLAKRLEQLRARKKTPGPTVSTRLIEQEAPPPEPAPTPASPRDEREELLARIRALEERDQARETEREAERTTLRQRDLEVHLMRAIPLAGYRETPALLMFLKSKCKWDGGQNRWVYVFDDQPDGARPITQTTLDELVTTIKWDAEENGFAPNGPTPRPTAAPTVESTPRTPKEIRAARNQASLLEAIQELRQAAGYARQQPSSDALVGKMWRAQRKVTELEQGHEDGESRVDRAARAPDYAPPSASETTGSSGSDAGNAAAWRMIREGRQGKRS